MKATSIATSPRCVDRWPMWDPITSRRSGSAATVSPERSGRSTHAWYWSASPARVTIEEESDRRAVWPLVAAALGIALIGVFLSVRHTFSHPSSSKLRYPLRLTNNPANDLLPKWSPLGSRIVFTSNRDGMNAIYVMRSDGSDVKKLTSGSAEDFEASWSPDGSQVLFAS